MMFRVRAVLSGWAGGPGLSTFYFEGPVDNLASAQLCADRVRTAFTDAAQLFPNSVNINVTPEVDIVDPGNGEITNTFSVVPGAAIIGGSGDSSQTSPACALLIRYNTATFNAGRRLQGRTFLSPCYSQMVDGVGSPTAAAINLGQAFGAALLDPGVGDPALVVWRRPRDEEEPPNPKKPARVGSNGPVIGVTVPDRFAILRSRRP